MINNNKGESFVWVIVGVFILAIAILGIFSLITYSRTLIYTYETNARVSILRNNLSNIVAKLDTSKILENEVFYIYQNQATQNFEVFTGSTNVEYKYIDKFGIKIDDLDTYDGVIYSRQLLLERVDTSFGENNQIIKWSIKQLVKQ